MALLHPTGLVHGHYECRSLDETLPIFTDLMAAEIVGRAPGIAAVKHPNTDWLLVIHEGGEGSPRKPLGNHYGFRVADHTEVEAAYTYIKNGSEEVRDHDHIQTPCEPLRLLYLHEGAGWQYA
jgi:hypothetical protein